MDEQNDAYVKLLEFTKQLAQMAKANQEKMHENSISANSMRQDLDKILGHLSVMMARLPGSQNFCSLQEATASKHSAELHSVHAICKDGVVTESARQLHDIKEQVKPKTGGQPGATGVEPVSTELTKWKPMLKVPPAKNAPTPVSLEQALGMQASGSSGPAELKATPVPTVPDVDTLVSQVAHMQSMARPHP